MKILKVLAVFMLVGFFMTACEDELRTTDMTQDSQMELKGDKLLVGAHFNLNIIGVKDKTMDDIAAGGVIFVDLYGTSEIHLQEGDDFAVLDKNGTDDDGALFQLPNPGIEAYVTEYPLGFDTETDYSVWARPLGKPLTGATITTMAELTALAEYIATDVDKKAVRLWDNLVEEFGEDLTITWGDFVPNPVTFERLKGKSTFQDVTAELLTVVYEILVTYDDDDDPETPDVEMTFHVRIPIFDDLLEGEYWKYENDGLKLLQVRFYPFGVDVSLDDGFWDE